MCPDDLDADLPHNDHDEHDHDEHDHDEHEVEDALEEALELDTQSQIFLEMRRQNLELCASPPRSRATQASTVP